MKEIRYKASPTASLFHRDISRYRCLMGPWRTGKSVACSSELIRQGSIIPAFQDGIRRSRYVAWRNTYPQLRDSTIRTFMDWYGKLGTYKVSDKIWFGRWGDVEMEVWFRAMDNKDDIDNLLSTEFTGAWGNEARDCSKEVFDAVTGRIGQYPKRVDVPEYHDFIILDTNPPHEEHWIPELFDIKRQRIKTRAGTEVWAGDGLEGYRIWHQPKEENEPNLKPKYYELLAVGKSKEFCQVYIEGEYAFVTEGAPVHPDFNTDSHVRPCQPIPNVPILRGWDFGRTPVCVFGQVTPAGTLQTFHEKITPVDIGSGVKPFAEKVRAACAVLYPGYEFHDCGDPAGNAKEGDDKSAVDRLREVFGESFTWRNGGINRTERKEGLVLWLTTMVGGKPAFALDPSCRMLKYGLQGGFHYREIQGKTGRYEDKPDKNEYSHPCEALEYLAGYALGEKSKPKAKPEPQDFTALVESGALGNYYD